jgi:putative copper export protein
MPMNGPDLIMRWVHIVAAATLVGSIMLALGARIPIEQLRRGRMVFHGAMGLIVLTGLANYVAAMHRNPPPPPSYNMLLGIKIVLALIVFGLSVLALRPPRADDDDASAEKRKHTLLAMAAAVAILIILVIEIAVMLPPAGVAPGS